MIKPLLQYYLTFNGKKEIEVTRETYRLHTVKSYGGRAHYGPFSSKRASGRVLQVGYVHPDGTIERNK